MKQTEDDRVSPGSEVPAQLPTTFPTPGAERDVLRIMSSRASLASDADLRVMAVQLLGAGYTPAEVSRRLKMHPGAVYDLTKEPEIAAAIAAGADQDTGANARLPFHNRQQTVHTWAGLDCAMELGPTARR